MGESQCGKEKLDLTVRNVGSASNRVETHWSAKLPLTNREIRNQDLNNSPEAKDRGPTLLFIRCARRLRDRTSVLTVTAIIASQKNTDHPVRASMLAKRQIQQNFEAAHS
jgi:hypothetical protein